MSNQKGKTVVFALIGDVLMNSRALKQFDLFKSMELTIEAFSFSSKQTTSFGKYLNLHHIPIQKSRGPKFYWEVHRYLRDALPSVDATIYHASDLFVLPALSKVAKKKGKPILFDSRELYPHVAATANKPWVSWFWHQIQKRYLPQVDSIFTVSESIATYLNSQYALQSPPILLPNVPIFQQVPKSTLLKDRLAMPHQNTLFLHQGKMMKSRGGTALIHAMKFIEQATLLFLGDGPEENNLKQLVHDLNLGEKVKFLPPVPPNELLAYTASADVGITFLEDTCLNHRFALPNKLFEYLMAGLPVVSSNLTEISNLINRFQVGIVVDPNDETSLVTTLSELSQNERLRKELASNSPKVFETFSWEKASQRFINVYQKYLNP